MLPSSSGLEVTQLETECSSAKLVSMMPISWHYEGDLSWYKIMIYKLMCLLKTMCFHLGMTSDYIWDYGTPHERVATEEEFDRITKDVHYEFVKDGGKIQYSHKVWLCKGHSHLQDPVSLPGGPVHVGFVVDKVALQHFSFQIHNFCHVTVIPYTYLYSILSYSLPVCLIQVMDSAI